MNLLIFLYLHLAIVNCFVPSKSTLYTKRHSASFMMNEEYQEEIDKYATSWYVIGETSSIRPNKLYKTQIWNKDYVFWKHQGLYYALNNDCSHRGASLSGGKLKDNKVVCPYHAYEFENTGKLTHVPGLNFTNTPCKNQESYAVLEKNGWIYLNPEMSPLDLLRFPHSTQFIFQEPESDNSDFCCVLFNKKFNAYGRVVSENSLDVMHIAFVHTFGNKNSPSPIAERPPHKIKGYPNHYRTSYDYIAGSESLVKKVYFKDFLKIENEFVIPHTTIARVIFDEKISTIVTFATPHNDTHCTLYVKTYRNFWYDKGKPGIFNSIYNFIGDYASKKLMEITVEQDREIVENIYFDKKDGKFNMKFDKLQSVYKQYYNKLVETQKKEKE